MHTKTRENITYYREKCTKEGVTFEESDYLPIVLDEITAAYAEDILTNTDAWKYIFSKEPTFGQKDISFLHRFTQSNAKNEEMSAAGRRFLRKYKKLFNKLSARNAGNNAYETAGGAGTVEGMRDRKYPNARSAIKEDRDYGKVAYIDNNVIVPKDGQTIEDAAREYFETNLNGLTVEVESTSEKVNVKQKKKYLYHASKRKLTAIQILDDIISIGTNKTHKDSFETSTDGVQKKHLGLSAERGFDYYDTTFSLTDGTITTARVVIRKSGDGSDYFYDLDRMKTVQTKKGNETANVEQTAHSAEDTARQESYPTDSIPDSSENVKENENNSERYALNGEVTEKDIDVIRSIGRKSINKFTSEDIRKTEPWARKFYRELGTKSPFFRAWFGDWRQYDDNRISYVPVNKDYVSTEDIPRGEYQNADTEWTISVVRDVIEKTANESGRYSNEFRSLKSINEMIANSVLIDTVVIENPSKKLGSTSVFMHHLYCPITVKGKKSVAKLYIAESITEKRKFYLTKIEEVSQNSSSADNGNIANGVKDTFNDTPIIRISELYNFVKNNVRNYEKDSKNPTNFSPKPVNEALLNEDKTPKVLYHGTNNEFTVFDKYRINTNEPSGDYIGSGYYFTSSKSTAKKYGKNVIPVYLSMNKPLVINSVQDAKDFRNTFMGMYNGNEELRKLIGGDYDYFSILEENPSAIKEELHKRGYDGLVDNIYGQYAVFDASQIKSATDNIGTFNSGDNDIRFALNDSGEEGNMSRAERAKFVANNTRSRVYSVADAESVINSIIENQLSVGDEHTQYAGKLDGKTKKQATLFAYFMLGIIVLDMVCAMFAAILLNLFAVKLNGF